jgi:ribosomal protein S18 acetylase RimI-like enzyme
MQPWTVEYGTFWAVEPGLSLPPICSARVRAEFEELGVGDAGDLTSALNLPSPEPILRRLHSKRRCFSLKVQGQIASYGWVTRGAECVGELERQFHLRDDEAYIWDCGTVPAWRGQRCYSALLSHLIYQLHHEGIPRIWIGASRQNQSSIRAFANAGFQPVVDVAYRRFHHLTLMWIRHAPAAPRPLVSAAYRILLSDHERRLGQLIVGYNHV